MTKRRIPLVRRVKLVSLTVIILSLLTMARTLPVHRWVAALQQSIEGLGFWGPVIFALVYVAATVLMLPGSVLTLAAGATFGLLLGTVTVSIGSTTGAALAFLIARYLARDKVEEIAREYPGFRAVDEAIAEGGWKVVALLRLSPLIPFNLQNYLYGLTSIRFWTCVLTSWIAMLPGTFLYIYLGYAAGSLAVSANQRTPGQWVMLGVGLLATVIVTIYLTKIAKIKLAALSEQQGLSLAADTPTPPDAGQEPVSALAGALIAILLAVLLGGAALYSVIDPAGFQDRWDQIVPISSPNNGTA